MKIKFTTKLLLFIGIPEWIIFIYLMIVGIEGHEFLILTTGFLGGLGVMGTYLSNKLIERTKTGKEMK